MALNPRPDDDWKFEGFAFPTTTPVPDQVFDELLYHLSPTEIVVLLYIVRRTFGFKKTNDNISLKQLCEGIQTSDGRILDRGTGLSKATVARVVKSLETKRVINRVRRRSRKKGDQPTTYELNFLAPVSQDETGGVSEMKQGVSHGRDTQQTVKQQTDSVVVELTKRGISEKVAKKLATEHPADYMLEKVDLLDYLIDSKSHLIERNPAGYLRKAITEDYQPPKGFKTRQEREADREAEERAREELRAAREAEIQEKQRQRERIIDAHEIPQEIVILWDRVLDELRAEDPRSNLTQRLGDTFLLSVEEEVAIVGVATVEDLEWLSDRAAGLLSSALSGRLAKRVAVRFEVLDV